MGYNINCIYNRIKYIYYSISCGIMNFKKIMLISIFLLTIFMIGTVSAVDDNSSFEQLQLEDSGEINESLGSEIEIDNHVDDLKSSENDDVLTDYQQESVLSANTSSSELNSNYDLYCDKDMRYGGSLFKIYGPENAKGNLTVEIDGQSCDIYKLDKQDGKHTVFEGMFRGLDYGNHKVHITYHGDEVYAARSVDCEISVIPKIFVYTSLSYVSNSFSSNYPQGAYIKFPTNAKGKLVVKFYNSKNKVVKKLSKKISNKKAYINFYKYSFYGKFSKAVISYSGSDYKVPNKVIKKVYKLPNISVPKSMKKGQKKYISIKVPGKKGVLKVRFNYKQKNGKYNHKSYSKKLVKGKAKISLSKLPKGSELSFIKFIQTLKSGKKVTYFYDMYGLTVR